MWRADCVDGAFSPRRATPQFAEIARPLVDALIARLTSQRRSDFLAIDGRSAAGKSTLEAALVETCKARGVTGAVIEGDDFYAGGTAVCWDRRSPADNADHVIDWRRQHRVLDDLRTHSYASWYPSDWDALDLKSDRIPVRSSPTSMTAAEVIILEGAYSARPEPHDVLDVSGPARHTIGAAQTAAPRARRHEHRTDWKPVGRPQKTTTSEWSCLPTGSIASSDSRTFPTQNQDELASTSAAPWSKPSWLRRLFTLRGLAEVLSGMFSRTTLVRLSAGLFE